MGKYICPRMQAPLLFTRRGQKLWLSEQRCIFWEEEKALILSDLHFGKTGHFRKSGIAVPQDVYKEDLHRLVTLLHHFKPTQLIIAGDFFHSHANSEIEWFHRWRNNFSTLRIILVKGNHDILKTTWYQSADIEVAAEQLCVGPFLFTHDKCAEKSELYNFCGHLHPGILLQGLGKQSLRLPCFYFAKNHCVLPAFSRFTGTSIIRPTAEEHVFAIADQYLVAVQ